jgi:hypothetical protein
MAVLTAQEVTNLYLYMLCTPVWEWENFHKRLQISSKTVLSKLTAKSLIRELGKTIYINDYISTIGRFALIASFNLEGLSK